MSSEDPPKVIEVEDKVTSHTKRKLGRRGFKAPPQVVAGGRIWGDEDIDSSDGAVTAKRAKLQEEDWDVSLQPGSPAKEASSPSTLTIEAADKRDERVSPLLGFSKYPESIRVCTSAPNKLSEDQGNSVLTTPR